VFELARLIFFLWDKVKKLEEETMGSVGFYFLIFLCSLILQISDRGSLILTEVILFGVYKFLTGQEFHSFDAIRDLIWHKQVSLKVSIFAWRVLRNRLLTKDNLVARDIITHDAQLCVTGCGGIETTQHMFLSCPNLATYLTLFRLSIVE
jgi:hypothetical protein